MEKKIIITGTPKAIENIIRENRIREKRGEVTFQEIIPEKQEADSKKTETQDQSTNEDESPETQETPDAKEPETTENKPGKRTNNK